MVLIENECQPLASYRGPYFKQCQEAFRGLDALKSTTLMTASYIVAFHHVTCVRMLGFSEEGVARAVYGAIKPDLSKVLMRKYSSKASLSVVYENGYTNQLKAIGLAWLRALYQAVQRRGLAVVGVW
jgi:tRNA threonylcarbamoyladenosine modification (KEOPS) complex  Pcc1 subunit